MDGDGVTMSKVTLRGSLTQMAEQVLAHLSIDRKTPDYERLRRVALDELLAVCESRRLHGRRRPPRVQII